MEEENRALRATVRRLEAALRCAGKVLAPYARR
jgi:hypothetical protein